MKEALLGKSTSAPAPDIPDRRPLVMPPANASLPVPGSGPENPQWSAQPQADKQQADATPKPAPSCSGGSGNGQNCEQSSWMSRIFQ
jgi:hypothetical protein